MGLRLIASTSSPGPPSRLTPEPADTVPSSSSSPDPPRARSPEVLARSLSSPGPPSSTSAIRPRRRSCRRRRGRRGGRGPRPRRARWRRRHRAARRAPAAAGDRFDAGQHIALAARPAAAAGEIHDDRGRALSIHDGVAPAAAVDPVVAGTAVKPIPGGATAQDVAPGAAEQVIAAPLEQSVGGDRVVAGLAGQAAGAAEHVVASAAPSPTTPVSCGSIATTSAPSPVATSAPPIVVVIAVQRAACALTRTQPSPCGHRRAGVADAPFTGTEPVDRDRVAFPRRGEVLHVAGREVPEDVVVDPRLRHTGRGEAGSPRVPARW